jgi:hypothetical protein
LPYELNTGNLQALKNTTRYREQRVLWLEFRQSIGQYDSTLVSQIYTGALAHYEDSTTSTYTHCWTSPRQRIPMLTRPLSGISPILIRNLSVSVSNATSSGVSVAVNYGPIPCVRNQPTVSISPNNPSIYWGTNVNYTVTVTTTIRRAARRVTFNVASTAPTDWVTSLSALTLTLNPTQSGNVTMTKTACLPEFSVRML